MPASINRSKFPITKNKFIMLAIVAALILYSFQPTKFIASVVLLFLIPGSAIFSLFCKNKYNFFEYGLISFILGLSYRIITGYYLSFIGIRFIDPIFLIVLSLVPAIFTREIKFSRIDKTEKIRLFVLALVIAVAYLLIGTPRSYVASTAFNEVGPFPTGDDSKLHAMLVNEILNAGKLPSSFALYPEFSSIRYPMGYHLIIAEMSALSGEDSLKLMFYSGQFMFSLLILIIYIAGKKIFSDNAGFYAGLLVVGSMSPFKFLILGIYPNMLAILTHILSVLFLWCSLKDKNYAILLGFISASTLLTNIYPFILTFAISIIVLMHRKTGISIFAVSLILFSAVYLPSILNFQSSEEHRILYEKFYPALDVFDKLTWASNINELMAFVNIALLIFGLIGVVLLEEKYHKVMWYSWFFMLVVLFFKNLFPLAAIPFWYYIMPEKILYHMFIPASLSAGYAISKLMRGRPIGSLAIILFISVIPILWMYNQEDKYEYKYITAGDIEYSNFIKNVTTINDVIFNDYYVGTSTTWIPVLSGRKVTFPFLIFDPAVSKNLLKADDFYGIKTVAAAPDSKEALDYIKKFNASYIAFSTFFREEWDEKKFFESRCYEKLYGKNDLWLFKVNATCPYNNWLTLVRIENISIAIGDKETEFLVNYTNLTIGPPITDIFGPYLYMRFNDTGIVHPIKMRYSVEGRNEYADIDIVNTKKEQLLIVPLKQEIMKYKTLQLFFPEELTIYSLELKLHTPNSYYANGINFVGNWENKGDYFVAPSNTLQSFILISNMPPGMIRVSYLDESNSNVDINVYDGAWRPFYNIYRTGTGNIKTFEKEINETVPFMYLGIYPRDFSFSVKSA